MSLDQPRAQSPDIADWVLAIGLCAALIFAILAFGAVDEWASFAFEAATGLLFLLWAAKQAFAGQVNLSNNPLYLPAILFFILILVQLASHHSAYGYATRHEILRYVSNGIVLFVAAECVYTTEIRRFFLLSMSIFGGLYALFAAVQTLSSNGKIFWLHSPKFTSGLIFGSYVNHNHYAGLLEMLTPMPLVISMGHLLKGGKRVLAGSAGVLMATTIFVCGSRGGMIAFIFETVLFVALAYSKKRTPRVALGSMALCAMILSLLVFLGKGQALVHLGELAPGIRLNIAKDSLRMFAHRPLLGWGLGTFPTVYPRYRSFYTNLFVNEAHNDYAQLLVETGLVGFGLMVWFVLRLYQRGLSLSRRWEFQWDWALSFAAFLGCTGILVHSFVDFNLQIPANAAFFCTLCGLVGSKPPQSPSKPVRRSSRVEETPSQNGEEMDWKI